MPSSATSASCRAPTCASIRAGRRSSPQARREVADADAAMVTSYCPDGRDGRGPGALRGRSPLRLLRPRHAGDPGAAKSGAEVPYLPAEGLGGFDLVLSYTGGAALDELRERLGPAGWRRSTAASIRRRTALPIRCPAFQGDFSYLGTYAADRQEALERLLLEPAGRLPEKRFVIGGAQYPVDFPWGSNIFFVRHLPPADHPAFFASSPLTLNVTRAAMARWATARRGGCSRRPPAARRCSPIPGRGSTASSSRAGRSSRRQPRRRRRDPLPPPRRRSPRGPSARGADARRAHRGEAGGGDGGDAPDEGYGVSVWGIVPAAGIGSRIQPLAFSKELLPVGSRVDGDDGASQGGLGVPPRADDPRRRRPESA